MQQEIDHRNVGHVLAAVGQRLVILAQPAVPAQPCERALDDPSFRQHDELAHVRPLDDLDHSAQRTLRPRDELAGVPAVGPDHLQPTEVTGHFQQNLFATVAVLHGGAMHDHRQDQAQRVDANMPLSSGDLLARVVAVRPPFRGAFVLTDCESITPADGVGLRPALRRTFSRSLS